MSQRQLFALLWGVFRICRSVSVQIRPLSPANSFHLCLLALPMLPDKIPKLVGDFQLGE
jgi:hypothetical protein